MLRSSYSGRPRAVSTGIRKTRAEASARRCTDVAAFAGEYSPCARARARATTRRENERGQKSERKRKEREGENRDCVYALTMPSLRGRADTHCHHMFPPTRAAGLLRAMCVSVRFFPKKIGPLCRERDLLATTRIAYRHAPIVRVAASVISSFEKLRREKGITRDNLTRLAGIFRENRKLGTLNNFSQQRGKGG